MRVYYDFQILASQKYGGISRYFYELYSRLRAMGVDAHIDCARSINYYFKDQFKMHNPTRSRVVRKLCYIYNRVNAILQMRKSDIIHPTYYNPYMLGHYKGSGKCKLVVSLHDMIAEKFNILKHDIEHKRKMLHAADRIISVSHHSKKDALEIYPDLDPDKISVIHQGNSIPETKSDGKNPLGRPYVLFMGHRNGYKNFTRFAEAMRPVLETNPDLCVYCVGGGRTLTEDELGSAKSLSSRFFHAFLSDDEIRQAYANAECFVFPSQYEGFGLPVLESFACNCPLVCSNSSSLPEVAGDSAEYFDPLNTEEMTAKILKVIEDDSLRARLRSLGSGRLQLFSWDKNAAETFDCYKHVLEG